MGSVDFPKWTSTRKTIPGVLSLNGGFQCGNPGGWWKSLKFLKRCRVPAHVSDRHPGKIHNPLAGQGLDDLLGRIILPIPMKRNGTKFKSDHTMKLILDRIVKGEVPYCLSWIRKSRSSTDRLLKRATTGPHRALTLYSLPCSQKGRLNESNKVDMIQQDEGVQWRRNCTEDANQ